MLVRDTTTPAGSDSSFARSAFEQYRLALHRYLMRRVHSEETARDLAQEAYLRLLRVHDAETVHKPLAYLYRIAANVVYEFRLRERNERVSFDSQALEQLAEHPQELADELAERLSTQQQLEHVLAQLPPLYQAVFVLRKRDGMSYPEIARTLQISVHTVKKYLARAIVQCRAADWGV
jgi:RNA polymerase sigma-70 factor (ECF subfamily)